MSQKDEILQNAKRLREAEEARQKQMAEQDKPIKYTTGMPLGCWLWLAFFAFLAYCGLKKFF